MKHLGDQCLLMSSSDRQAQKQQGEYQYYKAPEHGRHIERQVADYHSECIWRSPLRCRTCYESIEYQWFCGIGYQHHRYHSEYGDECNGMKGRMLGENEGAYADYHRE